MSRCMHYYFYIRDEADLLNVHVDFPLFQRLALPIQCGRSKIPGIKIPLRARASAGKRGDPRIKARLPLRARASAE